MNRIFYFIVLLIIGSVVIFSADVIVEYRCGEPNTIVNQIRPYLNIVNTGTSDINLTELTVHYFYTRDGTTDQEFHVDFTPIGIDNVTGLFVNDIVIIGFNSGILGPGEETGEIQLRINKTDWSNYDQSDDYSFDPTKTSLTAWDKVEAYLSGILVYGLGPYGTPPITPGPTDPTPEITPLITPEITPLITPEPQPPGVGDVWLEPGTQTASGGDIINLEIHANTGTLNCDRYGFDFSYHAGGLDYIGYSDPLYTFITSNIEETSTGQVFIDGKAAYTIPSGNDIMLLKVYFRTIGGTPTVNLGINTFIDMYGNVIGIPNPQNATIDIPNATPGITSMPTLVPTPTPQTGTPVPFPIGDVIWKRTITVTESVSGEPIPNSVVKAIGNGNNEAVTGTDGTCSIVVWAHDTGSIDLTVTAPGFVSFSDRYPGLPTTGEINISLDIVGTPTPSPIPTPTQTPVPTCLPCDINIEGIVTDTQENPIPGVIISIMSTQKATTDARGYYQFTTEGLSGDSCPVGDAYLFADATGYKQGSKFIGLGCGDYTYYFTLEETAGETPPPKYHLTVQASGGGTVTVNPPGNGVTSTDVFAYAPGTEVVLTPYNFYGTPDENGCGVAYIFDRWEGDLTGTTSDPVTVTMTGDLNVTAIFQIYAYPCSTPTPTPTITPSPSPVGDSYVSIDIIDAVSKEPVEGAYVTVVANYPGIGGGGVTNAAGHFASWYFGQSINYVTVSKDGYETLTIPGMAYGTHELIPISTIGAGEVWLQPKDLTVNTGEAFSWEVHANSGNQKIASFEIIISWPMPVEGVIVYVDDSAGNNGVDPGTGDFVIAANSGHGSITITGFDATQMGIGPGSGLNLCTIHFKAGPMPAPNTLISVVVVSLNDETNVPVGTPVGLDTILRVEESSGTLGDANDDGQINIIDALIIAQEYVGLSPSPFNPDAADVNCDGQINIVDALIVAQYYVELISGFCL